MIDGAEKDGVLDFLNTLNPDDVFLLAAVITKNYIKLESIQDANDAILIYAKSARDVLCRQKIHKQSIFNYLHQKKIYVDPNSNKEAFMDKAIDFWNRQQTEEVVNTILRKMGEDFSKWFYHLLNSVNSLYRQLRPPPSVDSFSSSHFSPDCELILTEFGPDGSMMSTLSFLNANDCCIHLVHLVSVRDILFEPNPEFGVKTKQDAPGLVEIVVTGRVYYRTTFIGVFEQTFRLVTDLLQPELWKIKFTKIIVHHLKLLCFVIPEIAVSS